MRIAYFDCFSGISGDMTIGAFLDAGLDLTALSRELAKLKLNGYELRKKKIKRGELSGTKFDCIVDRKTHEHHSLNEILGLIKKSSLNKRVKTIATEIFSNIGDAEAKVHGIGSKADIRFHELGDIDSIIDIVGTAIAIDEFGIDAVYSSKVHTGRTFVKTAHGTWPIPAPAMLELLKGVPMKISEVEGELVTPTGAGILKTLAKSFGEAPQMKICEIGYGAGTNDYKVIPNMLRVIFGEPS